MTTSPYVSDTVVEVAFNAGYRTAPGDRVWVDVSEWVEAETPIDINFGRSDERSEPDANVLSLTLDNSDGRFTAERPESPYYPNVRIGRPIRVTLTPPGGTASTRFIGYVELWPTAWDGTEETATASIMATSRMTRLGFGSVLRSTVEEEILVDNPIAFYPLSEAAGARSAANLLGATPGRLRSRGAGVRVGFGASTIGTYPELTAATFGSGYWLEGGGGLPVPSPFAAGLSGFEVSAIISTPGAVVTLVEAIGYAGAPPRVAYDRVMGIYLNSGTGEIYGTYGAVTVTGPVVVDNEPHHYLLEYDDPNVCLYVDGVLVASAASLLSPLMGIDTWTLGRGFFGTLANVAFYRHVLGADVALSHANAVLNGFTDETSDERIAHYLRWVGVSAPELDFDTGDTMIAHIPTAGTNVTELIKKVASAEEGTLFDAPAGPVTFHSRSHRYDDAVALSLDMAEHHVESDYSPALDRSTLLNDVSSENIDGTVTGRVVDADSDFEYGTVSTSLKTVSADDDDVLATASWRVAIYSEPRGRVPSLSVDVGAVADDVALVADLLAATIGTLVEVTNHPTQAASSTKQFYVEGYTETIHAHGHQLAFNVSPSFPFDSLFVIDSSDIDGPDLIAI